jgi:serine/threonine protein kinase
VNATVVDGSTRFAVVRTNKRDGTPIAVSASIMREVTKPYRVAEQANVIALDRCAPLRGAAHIGKADACDRCAPLRGAARIGKADACDRKRNARYGEFEVIAPLARGGMGGVYLAVHHATGERVALKVLDPVFASHPEIVARLRAEHALASRAEHPGLVEIRAARTTSDGVPYLVMEYLDGHTLATIADGTQLDLPAVVAVCAQLAAALAALHAAGVIHCDVKHENVFVLDDRSTGFPRVKLIDFGVSRTIGEVDPDPQTIAGTPWCMAPEQWKGHPETASDVYALGCLLYELITGNAPFDGSLPELMLAHLEQRPARPSWLVAMPAALERLILRALAKDPACRPTMGDMADQLAQLADSYDLDLRAAG